MFKNLPSLYVFIFLWCLALCSGFSYSIIDSEAFGKGHLVALLLLFSIGMLYLVATLYKWNSVLTNPALWEEEASISTAPKIFRNFFYHLAKKEEAAEQASKRIEELINGDAEGTEENSKEDPLNLSINGLSHMLKRYRKEEVERKWASEGLAHFTELLRQEHANINTFSTKIISELIRYLDANQGALFVKMLDEEDEQAYLLGTGLFAYGRSKWIDKRIQPGEGLLGQCMLEKETIYLTEIPSDFIKIRSGLGDAPPKHVIVQPLMNDEEFIGAIELASFKILSSAEVNFLQEISKNIAAKINQLHQSQHTKDLLLESQKLTEELRSGEEEMRQNMEELSSTQEEMSRKQAELEGVFEAINNRMMKAEFNTEGQLLNANDKFREFFNEEDLSHLGEIHRRLIADQASSNFWQALNEGQHWKADWKVALRNFEEKWLDVFYSPVLDEKGRVAKILLLSQNITERKLKEKEFERLSLVADNTDNSVVITNPGGGIEYVNKGFEQMTGYRMEEVLGKKPGSFLQGEDTDEVTIKRIREKLNRCEPIYEEILNYTKSGNSYWVSLAINPVFDEKKKIKNYIAVQADITKTKEFSLDSMYKLEAIGRSNAILELNMEAEVSEVNENFAAILGYDIRELQGQSLSNLVFGDTMNGNSVKDHWDQLQKGTSIHGEFGWVSKNREAKYTRGVFNPILDLNGSIHKVIFFGMDSTAEQALKRDHKKQEVLLKHYMEAIDNTIASLVMNPQGQVQEANDIYLSVTGYSQEEIKGKSYFDLLPEADRLMPRFQLMWESLKEGKFFSGEFKQLDKHGHEVWSSGTINPIKDINEEVQKIVLLSQFTTREKQKLNELNGTVTAFKSIMPLLELTIDFQIKSANPLFFEMTGYQRMDLKSLDFAEFCIIPPVLNHELILQKLKQGEMLTIEIQFKNKKQENESAKVIFSPIFNLDHDIDKIMLLFTSKLKKGKINV